MTPMVRCYTSASNRLQSLVKERLKDDCGNLQPKHIVIKPNWVLHETNPIFPIKALVTDSSLIEAVVESCSELFPSAESITVADCPLQWADWHLMCQQSGLTEKMDRLRAKTGNRLKFIDLRREVYAMSEAGFLEPAHATHGDPSGYCEVALGKRSHLEPIADQADKFAVNDYSSAVTSSNHSKGHHNYLVSQTVLNSDLFINLPKWKCHQKSGITAALKNLVGINGDKAYLPHFRRGAPKWGGDEYADDHRWLYWAQTTLRELTQKRSPLLFKLLKPGWEMVKRLRGIQTKYTDRQTSHKNFYSAGGAWYGNDTVWRMIYDLNFVIQCVTRDAQISESPCRGYYCIVDGLTSGEGNGPLQPLPRETDWLIFGQDPFAIDTALSHFMGFRGSLIPCIAQAADYLGPAWGKTKPQDLTVHVDDKAGNLTNESINLQFAPPPGWKGHIER